MIILPVRYLFGSSIAIFIRLLRLIRLLRFESASEFLALVFIVFMVEKLRSTEAVLTGRQRKLYINFSKLVNIITCKLGFEELH